MLICCMAILEKARRRTWLAMSFISLRMAMGIIRLGATLLMPRACRPWDDDEGVDEMLDTIANSSTPVQSMVVASRDGAALAELQSTPPPLCILLITSTILTESVNASVDSTLEATEFTIMLWGRAARPPPPQNHALLQRYICTARTWRTVPAETLRADCVLQKRVRERTLDHTSQAKFAGVYNNNKPHESPTSATRGVRRYAHGFQHGFRHAPRPREQRIAPVSAHDCLAAAWP